ncbi:hypothetical protein [Microseira sp. BLCC-F43]|jgi:5'-3' exonuclease|uniref:hypothetical protein n=1 Tax=Microseira sp. BLCC-F43 TaxID=3153602 RepID=UPI0035BAA3A1
MTTPTELRQRAIELVDQLPKEMLFEAVDLLESLCLKANQAGDEKPSISEESALLQIIGRRLPADDQKRLDDLRDRNEWGELNPAEYNELLAYEERVESLNVERVRALIELAKIRKVDLATLNGEFRSEETTSNDI